MTTQPFQFTLRRMFMAVAYLSAACAIAAWMIRSWQEASEADEPLIVLLSFLGAFGVCIFIGAGIGELSGNAWNVARRIFEAPFQLLAILFVLGTLLLTVAIILIAVVAVINHL